MIYGLLFGRPFSEFISRIGLQRKGSCLSPAAEKYPISPTGGADVGSLAPRFKRKKKCAEKLKSDCGLVISKVVKYNFSTFISDQIDTTEIRN
jgi:hypothetical protein